MGDAAARSRQHRGGALLLRLEGRIRRAEDGTHRLQLYVSGTLAFDADNNVVHEGDAGAQTRHVLETIKGVVEAAGGSMDDVTFNHIFLKDWADYGAINAVYAEYFPGEKPARYCIQCGLVKPAALVEIASVAHIGRPA